MHDERLAGRKYSSSASPAEQLTKLLRPWRSCRGCSVPHWRSLLGQTIARCASLRKRVDKEIAQLRAEAAEYLYYAHFEQAHDKVALASRGQKIYLAYHLIEDYCEQMIDMIDDIEDFCKMECSLKMRKVLANLLFAMTRCEEVVELHLLKPLITSKVGKAFVTEVVENSIMCSVDEKIMMLLSFSGPNHRIRMMMLEKIAVDFGIDFNVIFKEWQDTEINFCSSPFNKKLIQEYYNGFFTELRAFVLS
ncbi:hypothetical protein KP509_21G070900 [Ceratopteris richardii]|uniref:Uncharacterized protein n=1 Tax=Ceratopteris richardii TaxID=49495 RepID=A0A8T2SEA7_CERRI|nr:hypothetical protein KP509_21G070900 [Ceratopteris richardii]KAH7315924.1 hypothetical protein KP509_21G070900 [Ceratopteris richardii]